VSDDVADREHPAAETLSAYQANELSPEESGAIREHVAGCDLCAERLLDLQRFLEFVPEDQTREGVADLETAAEWRRLRKRIGREEERRRFFASARGGYTVAAALLAVSVGLAVWNLSLVRKSRDPVAVRTVRTLRAKESLRGGIPTENEQPVVLPVQITLDLPIETPDPLYRIDLFREGSRHAARSFEAPPQGSELRVLLPEQSLTPGHYRLRVHGVRSGSGQPSRQVWNYELIVSLSSAGPSKLQ